MPNKLRWEEVPHNWVITLEKTDYPAFKLIRAKVPGGWLVARGGILVKTQRHGEILNTSEVPGGFTFVPDPTYSWE